MCIAFSSFKAIFPWAPRLLLRHRTCAILCRSCCSSSSRNASLEEDITVQSISLWSSADRSTGHGTSIRSTVCRAVPVPDVLDSTRAQEPPDIWLIIGLGNPGTRYQGTRHNVGFEVVDLLARQAGTVLDKKQHNALVGRGILWGNKVLLAKPQTFMNLSGQAVGKLSQYYKVPHSRVLVVTDDLDLPTGTVRLRAKGGHGGHNGMRSIVQQFGGQTDFPRIRLGIGHPHGKKDVADYVLQMFNKQERLEMDMAVQQSVDALHAVLTVGMEKALSGVRP